MWKIFFKNQEDILQFVLTKIHKKFIIAIVSKQAGKWNGQLGEWLKPPDCKSGLFRVPWFESKTAHQKVKNRFF